MTISDLEHFKNLLLEREQNLTAWLESAGGSDSDEVRKVQSLVGEIKGALGRVENQSFGTCNVCKGTVELYRLEIQPVTEVCLTCITDKEREQLEEDLFLASKIHRALLPQTIEKLDGFDIAVKSLAARTIGGDYYDFLASSNGSPTRIIIADSMGSGLPAGLLMSNIQGALRILAEDIESPRRLVGRLNKWLCRNIPVTKFISLACVALGNGNDPSSQLVYANAGHCPPLVIKGNGVIEILGPTGGIVGVHEDFDYQEQAFAVSQGDLLILYTDGITEAENFHGEMFGEKRLRKFGLANRHIAPQAIIDKLYDEVRAFAGRPELVDDFTIIALRKL